jgi:predicted lipoprotein with Yx(FWY)xxD motif
MHLLATVLALVATATAAPAKPTVSVADSSYGRTIVDGRGFALYLFTKDSRRASRCSGACAKAWPPYVVAAHTRLRAAGGLKRSLLHTIRRKDGGRQVTYNGHPLYYYVGDTKPGQVLCQNVREYGGDWLIVKPNGRANHAPR